MDAKEAVGVDGTGLKGLGSEFGVSGYTHAASTATPSRSGVTTDS